MSPMIHLRLRVRAMFTNADIPVGAAARVSISWPPPFLLYLGNATDELAAKTARGLLHWRPELCLGQYRGARCRTTLNLPDMGFCEAVSAGARTMIIGVANAGGVMDDEMIGHVVEALDARLNVASGLHHLLTAHHEIVIAADRNGRNLFDARKAPPVPVGNGKRRHGHRLLTVGTDCSTGKMYTTLALQRSLQGRGVLADFRATGQTGIFITGQGISIDAVPADFISGAVEVLSPARYDGGWDLIEGQGSLFHPSYAGVSLGLLHGAQADALVLCHEPGRPHVRGLPHYPVPDLQSCLRANLDAAMLTSPSVTAVGISLNTARMSPEAADDICKRTEDLMGLPTVDPVRMGVEPIVDRLLSCFPD